MSNAETYDARALLLHASVVADLLGGLLDAHLAPARLTPREFEIATVLITRGPLPPGEIAVATGVPAPTASSRALAALPARPPQRRCTAACGTPGAFATHATMRSRPRRRTPDSQALQAWAASSRVADAEGACAPIIQQAAVKRTSLPCT